MSVSGTERRVATTTAAPAEGSSNGGAPFEIGPLDHVRGGRWLTIEEAARWLGVGRTTVYLLLDRREMWCIHQGRRPFIPIEALDEYRAQKIAQARRPLLR